MARFGLWVAVLAACLVVTVVNADPTAIVPPPDPRLFCQRASDGGNLLNSAQVFDMIVKNFGSELPNFGTKQLKEFMAYADGNGDNYLSMDECVKLLNYLDSTYL